MLDEVIGKRLDSVVRHAWQASDATSPRRAAGSAHLAFDDGWTVHVDGASDWTLVWRVAGPGDDNGWESRYDYESDGRWVRRNASNEPPFAAVLGSVLIGAVPLFDEVDEIVGMHLRFERGDLRLSLWDGEVDTTER